MSTCLEKLNRLDRQLNDDAKSQGFSKKDILHLKSNVHALKNFLEVYVVYQHYQILL